MSESLKNNNKWQHKLLDRMIDNSELANALTHNFQTLSRRELRNAVQQLTTNNIVIPFEIRLSFSKRFAAHLLDDLVDSLKGLAKSGNQKEKEKETLQQKQSSILEQLMDILMVWKTGAGWTPASPSFAAAVELQDELLHEATELEDMAHDAREEREARHARSNEAH